MPDAAVDGGLETSTMRMADLKAGWEILGNDGLRVGSIKEVGQNYLLVSRSGHGRDLYVPASAIAMVYPGSVRLNVDTAAAAEMGWEQPPRTGDDPSAADSDLHRHV
jgi:hypothetical protein